MTREGAVKGLLEVADWHYGKYEQTREEDYLNDGDFLTAVANMLKAQEPMVMAGAELTDAELIEKIRKAPITLKPAVDAIPVEWLREKIDGYASRLKSRELDALVTVLTMWAKEQEAR